MPVQELILQHTDHLIRRDSQNDRDDDARAKLEDLVEEYQHIDSMERRAHFCYDEIIPAMQALRDPADQLEMIVDKEYWPIPSYGDMIFEV